MNLWQPKFLTTTYEILRPPKTKIPAKNKIRVLANQRFSNLDERLLADVYIPLNGNDKNPTILMVHGGGWASRSKEDMEWHAKFYSTRGYVVININYRLAPQYLYPAPMEDLRAAYEWMLSKEIDFTIDAQKIFFMGYSSGGHLTSLLSGWVTEKKAGFEHIEHRGVIAGGMPADFMVYPLSPYISRFTSFYRDQNPELYLDASPITHVNSKSRPHFLYHARKDSLVEYEQMTKLEAKLKENGVKVETYTIERWDHVMSFLLATEPMARSIQFMESLT